MCLRIRLRGGLGGGKRGREKRKCWRRRGGSVGLRGDGRVREGCRCVYIVMVVMFSTQLPLAHPRLCTMCLGFDHWKARTLDLHCHFSHYVCHLVLEISEKVLATRTCCSHSHQLPLIFLALEKYPYCQRAIGTTLGDTTPSISTPTSPTAPPKASTRPCPPSLFYQAPSRHSYPQPTSSPSAPPASPNSPSPR
jgi:hypothetical protein